MIEGALFASGGRNRDIDFTIYGPDASQIYNSKIKKEGSFSVSMTIEGVYEFCFSNRMSTSSAKKVTLALHFEKPKASPDYLQVEDLLPVGVASDAVYSKVNVLNKELRFLMMRYANAKALQEETNRISTRFGVLEGLTVIVVAVIQVLYIRHIVSTAQPLLGRR